MKRYLTLYFLLISLVLTAQVQIGGDIDGEAAGDQSGGGISISSDGTRIAVGAWLNGGNGLNSGHVRIYEEIAGVWSQVGNDIDGEAAGDFAGHSVSLSADGSRIAIGAYGNDENGSSSGHVRIYEETGGAWSQVGSDIDGEAADDVFGASVSLSSDGARIAIGAFFNDGNGTSSGHVRIYKEVGGTWTQIGSDIDGEAANDASGTVSLSVDGTRVAVGASDNNGNGTWSGHVRIYEETNGIWSQVGSDIDGEAAGDRCGASVSFSADGSRIAIGAPHNDGNGTFSGHVRIYEETAGVWSQIGSDIDGEAAGDFSGSSISLSANGSRVAIGAGLNNGNGTFSGHVRIYEETAGVWSQIGSDIDGEASYDESGRYSISLSADGTRLAVGAQKNDGNGEDAGHVRVYDLSAQPPTELSPFITTWQTTTTNESITIPTEGNGYDFEVDWDGDGIYDNTYMGTDPDPTHVYASPGTHTVQIRGDFPRIYFSFGNNNKIQTIEQWGDIEWSSMELAFTDCGNLTYNASDTPDLSNVTSMANMFRNASSFNGAIGDWNVSTITNMEGLFQGASSFNQDLSLWNTASVTDMDATFRDATSFNQDISSWNTENVLSIGFMFKGASSFNQDLSSWNTSAIGSMYEAFTDATSFNQNLGAWDISSVFDMEQMLNNTALSQANYDETLIAWEAQNVSNFVALGAAGLEYCTGSSARAALIADHGWSIVGDSENCPFVPFITTWQTTTANESITIPTEGSGYDFEVDWDGDGIYDNTYTGTDPDPTHIYPSPGTHTIQIRGDFPRILFNFLGDREKIMTIEQWGDIGWISMAGAFSGCTNLTYNATDIPDLSGVTNMYNMFQNAESFNGDIGTWNVSTVTDMRNMFRNAFAFNQDIGIWETGSVVFMSNLFEGANSFNRDISGWDISSVTFMTEMFKDASSFNQDITNWNTSNVVNMGKTFQNAVSFDQNLGNWDISGVVYMAGMLSGSGLSLTNYDATLIGWEAQAVQSNVTLIAFGLEYCAGTSARAALIADHGWSVSGDTEVCPTANPFVTTWQTTATNESITIPTEGSGYNFEVDWDGDGIYDDSYSGTDPDPTHIYPASGTHTIQIRGDFPRIFFNYSGVGSKIKSIAQWGDIVWSSMNHAFAGCSNLDYTATDTPNLSQVTDMNSAFAFTANFNGNVSDWDVSTITDMTLLFGYTNIFNQDLSTWNTGSVTNMSNMFERAQGFNQDLNGWDVSSVTNMGSMFQNATSFNGNLSSWNTSSVSNMNFMFWKASAFNQDISNWNTSNVSSMSYMFREASSFNQDIGDIDISSVGNMQNMLSFSGISSTNYNAILIGWEAQNVNNGITLGADGLEYCAGSSARAALIADHGWTVIGDTEFCCAETCSTTDPLPITSGSYTSSVATTDSNGMTHFCSCNGELLLSIDLQGAVVPDNGVSVIISNPTAEFHPVGTGFVTNPDGVVVFNRTWAVNATTQPTTNNPIVRHYFTQSEYQAVNNELNVQNLSQLTDVEQLWFYKHTYGNHTPLIDIPTADVLTNGTVPDTETWVLGSHGTTDHYAEYAVSSFSGGGGGGASDGASALPIEWLHINATPKQNSVQIDWITATETNNAGFQIQRSTDSRIWQDIAWVPGAGTTDEPQYYTGRDNKPKEGVNYYRLAQEDFDGTIHLSHVVTSIWEKEKPLSVFPNPSSGIVQIRMEKAGVLEVINSLGQTLGQLDLIEGIQPVDLRGYGSGWFILRSGNNTIRVVVH